MKLPLPSTLPARPAFDWLAPSSLPDCGPKLETFEVKDKVTYDKFFTDISRPPVTVYVDTKLPNETIRTANPFSWPDQPTIGRVYHVDLETWHEIETDYLLTTGKPLCDLPFNVVYVSIGL